MREIDQFTSPLDDDDEVTDYVFELPSSDSGDVLIVDDDESPSGETWKGVSKDVLESLSADYENLPYTIAANSFPCQSSTFQTFGCLILWFGW